MLSISCEHPDLEEFIEIKSDLNKVTKANISVRITDKFMKAVKNKEMFTLSFTRAETGETITKEVNAYEIFHRLCEMNWDYAEPGMLFWDRIESWNLLSEDNDFHYAGTNPCAEEPLPSGGSCLLGSINLSEFVTNKEFNFNDFEDTVRKAVFALNEVLDEGLELHPLQEQKDSVRDWRQIGLGIFGLADMLIKMEIRYGSKKALEICDVIAFKMAKTAIEASIDYAAKTKKVFPKIKKDAFVLSPFYMMHTDEMLDNMINTVGIANSQLLTIAPTGSLSSMFGVSGGIEPIYANYYTRKTESLHGKDQYYKVYTPIVKQYMEEHDLKDDSELPEYFITAQNLNYKERIEMQSIWQKHIDASISSTVNVPNSFTIDDTEKLYLYAWEMGLKGVTIFRDGCKRSGILSTNNSKSNDTNLVSKNSTTQQLQRGMIIKVDNNTIGKERHLTTGCGSLHCAAFFDPDSGELLETYLSKGSQGGCQSNLAAVSRLMSLSARAGVDIYTIVDQLESCMSCPSYAVRSATKRDTSKGASCPSAVGKALLDMYKEMQKDLGNDEEPEETVKTSTTVIKNPCPECGEDLIFEGGCNVCKNCGYSKCD